jgi:hypothetical protein
VEARTDVLTVHVTVRVPVFGIDVNELEARCREAARKAMGEAVARMQEAAHAELGDTWERREWRRRHFSTRLGEVVLPMLKIRHRERRTTTLLGSVLLGLSPRQKTSRWVDQRAIELRLAGLSYRAAARTLTALTGARASAMTLWRRVQKKGAEARGLEEGRIEEVFEGRGGRPESVAPRHLFLDADEIHLKAQRSRSDTLRVKTGLSYTGREKLGDGPRARYRLRDKHLYFGVESFGRFGRGRYSLLERRHGVARAEAVLYLPDGDPSLRALRDWHFPQAIR